MTITPPNRQNLHVAEKEDARRIIPAQNSTAYFGPFNGWNLTPVSVSSILGGGKTFVCPASQRDISAPQKSTATQSNSLSNEHHNASKFIRAGKTTANRLTRQRAAKAGVDLHGEGYLRLEDANVDQSTSTTEKKHTIRRRQTDWRGRLRSSAVRIALA